MRTVAMGLLLLGLLFPAWAFAQEEAKDDAKEETAEEVRLVLSDVDELQVEAGTEIAVADTQRLHVFAGEKPGTHYLVVKLRRTIPADARAKLEDAAATLAFGSQRPVRPYAVALAKDELQDETTDYKVSDKRRVVFENYYFPVGEGQYEWTVRVNDKPIGPLAEHFVKLLVVNSQRTQARLALPNGLKPVINESRREEFRFPAGRSEVVLEVRGQTEKFEMPWKRYKKGDVKIIQMVDELREAPMLPVETIKGALPKIAAAWKIYGKNRGVGGGHYNISSRGDPVNVRIEFGRGGVEGGIYLVEANDIIIEYDDKGEPIRISERNRPWEIIPWDQAANVDVSKDAAKITGEARLGRFVIRATKKQQAVFGDDGMLKKGILFDATGSGYYDVDLIQQPSNKLVIVYGSETKEPK